MLGPASVLNITFHSATNLKDVDTGRNDPYIKFTTDLENSSSFQETTVKEDAGANATWEESFTIQVNSETTDLYVEVMDHEKGVDQIIGFASIPLVQANGGGVNGLFDIYTIKGEVAGLLNLTLGEPEDASPRPGKSYINDDHLERAKKLKHKALAGDIGEVAVGAGIAVGLGFLGKKLYDEYKAKNGEEEA
ncbi:C2 domain-containing protein [Phascolomyces articulosus]|uniref:C2 domain-containing protein n=1 Tax=Phascolomyces articulosus TaxID=60185 RepID=A0AAD5KSI6_9FUNG|nr:C2 domain-containing protein [Phascolomyces articulosus]